MKLPWIARSTHYALIEARDNLLQWERDRRLAAETKVTLLEGRLADTVQQLVDLSKPHPILTVGTGVVARETKQEVKQEPRERSVIANAIRDNAAGDPRLAAHFRGLARKLHLEGMGDEQIALEIGNWSTTEPTEANG